MMSFAETAVCGSILIDPRCLPAVRAELTGAEFSTALGKGIFEAACRLSDLGSTVDPVLIHRDLQKQGVSVTQQELLTLMEATPTAANCADYCRTLREEHLTAQASQVASRLQEQLQAQETRDTAISGAMADLERLQGGREAALISSEDAGASFLNDLEAFAAGARPGPVSTGIGPLDKLLDGGMIRSGLYIVGARPGTGKTNLALTIADHAAKEGPVLFVSLEMPKEQITLRRVSAQSGVPMPVMLDRTRLRDDELWERLSLATMAVAQRPVTLSEMPDSSVADIESYARSVKGLRLLVIDYLGLIRGEGTTTYDRITRISNDLKRCAKALKVPVLCLCQLNRASSQRAGMEPAMSDLRDSGAIEQDADGILLLHQPNLCEKNHAPQLCEPLEVSLVKNRHGSIGRFQLDFYGATARIREHRV